MKYGCQQYDQSRLCRFDRRAIDQSCDGCMRETDKDYLISNNLWINGISHNDNKYYRIITSSLGDIHGL